MTFKFISLTVFVSLVQFVSSCAAVPLSEQCRQLKSANQTFTESYYAHLRETDPYRRHDLLSQSYREKAKIIKDLSLSDSHLRGIQEGFVKNLEAIANREFDAGGMDSRQFIRSSNELIRLMKEDGNLFDDLEKYCQISKT